MTAIEFTKQIVEFKPSLLKYAGHFNLDKEESQDLVQETYLKAILNREKFVSGYMRAWLFTIMKNTFINNYRQGIRNNCERADDSYAFSRTKSPDSDNPESVLTVDELNKKIEELKDKFRIPFKMHIEGYKYKEIAETINVKVGTVKSRIFLARKYLINEINM